MLVGWVSDERDVALADVVVEFDQLGMHCAAARSTARGRIFAELPSGVYRVTLQSQGYSTKSSIVTVGPDEPPTRFRLLSDQLTGFMWPKWVRGGEEAEHRFHATEPYRLSLWRYGIHKEFVRPLGWFDEHGPNSVMQITPDGDYTQAGVGWNEVGYTREAKHTSHRVEAPMRTGLYYIHAEGETGAFFSAPWVVAPMRPSAAIAVLASTNTWNAYNNFGGRSNYINAVGLPPEPPVNGRQDLERYGPDGAASVWAYPDRDYPPISFERPEPFNHVSRETSVDDPIAGRQACHLAPAEWRLLGWLERENIAYDLYSDAQLDDGTLPLTDYAALIISTHPEYWTKSMFVRTRDWVESGGKLVYLGGNGINCEVEIVGSQMVARTYLSGDETGMHDEADPSVWWDSRFHRTVEAEASLLGVTTTASGMMTAAPYRAIASTHWVFEGTGLEDGSIFGKESLHERCPGGASGHETDKMSSSTPPTAILLAKGDNPNDGGAEMVYFSTPGGGEVFSVGSITYVASLLVDETISRVTRTVLERFAGSRS